MGVAGCPYAEDPVRSALRVATCAREMVMATAAFRSKLGQRVQIRVGLHSGAAARGARRGGRAGWGGEGREGRWGLWASVLRGVGVCLGGGWVLRALVSRVCVQSGAMRAGY